MKPSRRTVSHPKADAPFVELCPTFENARQTLLQLSETLTFVRVISMKVEAKNYMGEAVEVPLGFGHHSRDKPKTVFLDKFSRSRGHQKIGPMTLVQAPLGLDHPSSVPTIGELLVGTAVQNTRKSHLEQVFRGWCSNAKPLWELLRMTRQGTRMPEPKIRDLLIQLPCTMTLAPKDLRKYRDEIQMVGRMILQGNLRPLQVLASTQTPCELKEKATEVELEAAKNIQISSSATDFLDECTLKLNCPELQETFLKGVEFADVAMETVDTTTSTGQVDPQASMYSSMTPAMLSTSAHSMAMHPSLHTTSLPAPAVTSQFSGRPSTPPAQEELPKQMPTSPPASPKFMPTSPILTSPNGPEDMPTSKGNESPTYNVDDF